MRLIGFASLVVFVFALSGCSVRMQNLAGAAEEALFGNDDVALTEAEIAELPYAATYFETETSGRIVAVLDRATELQRVYRTGGEEAFVTRFGRIVSSSNMPGVPLYTSGLNEDPLGCWVGRTAAESSAATTEGNCQSSWQRTVELGNYGSNVLRQVKVSSTFEVAAQETYRHPDGTELQATKIIERGVFAGEDFSNEFYAVNGRVVFAKHYLSKDLGYGILQEIKPFNGDL
ncbi:YjbF family lipoprotein [Pseudidiomarina homiensis]|uniref:YjbF family lipoprotein n=1 Tax=Pseudidiomarina homiensis TaxID=364198 RepID=UPI00215B0F88|nr:YjbF family lipoprotein [Pseudidiomarina homiensis]